MTLAIDPGSTQSAYCLVDDDLRPVRFGKVKNHQILGIIQDEDHHELVIEMVACYGMPVGAEVFDTCVWIGRFVQIASDYCVTAKYIYRSEVKQNMCHSAKANDSTIKQALVDRFAKGVSNHGKGTKAQPGWFYGFSADIWSAYAVAVTHFDKG